MNVTPIISNTVKCLPERATAVAKNSALALRQETGIMETAGKEVSKLGKYGKIAAIAVAGLAALGLVAKGAADQKQEEAPVVYA